MSPSTFDLSERPALGLTVLEASAGTGKTFSLAALTVLGLARGDLTTRQLCVVTFTEAATAELVGRLRSRLAEAAEFVARWNPDDGRPNDPVDAVLVDADETERTARSQRLSTALAEFDAATISTIHGFCQRLLSAAGSTVVEVSADESDVVEAVRDHLLSQRIVVAQPDRIVTAVRRRLAIPDAVMGEHPDAKPEVREQVDEVIAVIESCVDRVLAGRARWKRRTFDSMLSDTRDLLADPGRGPAVVAELRARFRLVLIDEFQDTDRVQWDIFRTAFLDTVRPAPIASVVVVGDPKQSIYRFRGAELSAYLAAVEFAIATGGAIHSLDTNWRSDREVLDALEVLFTQGDGTGLTFGDDRVQFQQVDAGRVEADRGLVDPDSSAALRLHVLHPPENGSKDDVTAPDTRTWMLPDVTAEVVRLLGQVEIVRAAGRPPEPLRPSDIGVLVRSNRQAEVIADHLRSAGVPVSTSGTDSVLESAAGLHWLTLIEALQRPTSISSARAVAIGAFGDHDAVSLAALDEAGETALLDRVRSLIVSLTSGGLPRLLADLRRSGYPERLLGRSGGERVLTDLDHIAELLQRMTGGRPSSPSRLAAVFAELSALDTDSAGGELLDRRLDRDDDTVKLMTIHKAKGLEFPVVLLPEAWSSASGKSELRHAHDPSLGQRVFDTYWITGGKSTAKAVLDVENLAKAEEAGEHRRLLYVALTRAMHRLVVWEVPEHEHKPQPWRDLIDATCGRDFDAVAANSNGTIETIHVDRRTTAPDYTPPTPDDTPLDVAEFSRDLTSAWRVWSFSGIERAVADLGHHVEVAASATQPPLVSGGTDEPPDDSLRDVRGSAAFGSLVHGVFEVVDFTSPTLEDDLLAACADALAYGVAAISPEALALGLADAIRTPLGGPLGSVRLAELPTTDRLDELEFHLPLAAGSALDLARIVADGLPADDPMLPWFAAAADGALDVDVEGFLTGSIDLVARVGDRYLVADYKTNRISPSSAFTTDEMVAEMHRQGYPLQAVLYLVALRRYLAFRRPDLDLAEAIVGATYLFVRGMDPSSDVDDPRGVVWWTPPDAVLERLDRFFAGGARP
jgi:exodeoxyribonuclease V beta subunit